MLKGSYKQMQIGICRGKIVSPLKGRSPVYVHEYSHLWSWLSTTSGVSSKPVRGRVSQEGAATRIFDLYLP